MNGRLTLLVFRLSFIVHRSSFLLLALLTESQKVNAELKQFPAYRGKVLAIFVDASSPEAARTAAARADALAAKFNDLHRSAKPKVKRSWHCAASASASSSPWKITSSWCCT